MKRLNKFRNETLTHWDKQLHPGTSESFQFQVSQNEVPLKITRFLKRA